MRQVKIAEISSEASTWNPRVSSSDEPFQYIDISSVDAAEKRIGGVVTIAPSEAPSRARQIVRSDDVLVSTVRPNLNAVALVPKELDGATASTGFAILRADTANVDPVYLYHWVRSPQFVREMTARATGASYPAVTERAVRDSLLPLPPLAEQRRIAAILDLADSVHEKRLAILELVDQLPQSVFSQMFGDPSRNERGWTVLRLDSVLERADSGWSPTCQGRPATSAEWGILKLGAVTTCRYLDGENKALEEGVLPRPNLEVKAGDVLLTRKNTKDLVAACAYVWTTRERLMIPDLVYRLRLAEGAPVLPTYLCHMLIHPGIRKRVQSLARGSAGSMPNISKQRLACIYLPVPPVDLQRRFASVLARAENLRTSVLRQRACDSDLYKSLAGQSFRQPFR
jgi:type I restriction enzyme S subunit